MTRARRLRLPRPWRAAAAATLLLALAGGCRTLAPQAAPVRLTIVHVNDTHSHDFPFATAGSPSTGGFARLATVVKQVRASRGAVLLLHGGDAVVGSASDYLSNGRPDYGTIPTYGTRGTVDFEALSLLGFDAAVIGNHELDYGKRWLEGLIGLASFPVLSANVVRRELPPVPGPRGALLAEPYTVLRRGGLRIGIIGLTTEDYIKSLQVEVRDPIAAARELVPEVSRKADLLIVLSHLGFEKDLELARSVPGIDLIVGGHSHTLLPEPMSVGSTLIVQDGAYATHVGILDLTVEGGAIESYRYELKRLDRSVEPDPEVDAWLRDKLEAGSVKGGPLAGSDERQSGLGALATLAMLQATGAEAALLASDALPGEIPAGPVELSRFFEIFWPYRPRDRGPEKDLSERQLIELAEHPPDRTLRAVVRGSSGLRTLVVAEVPAADLAALLRANEARRGSGDYLQVGLRAPLGAGGTRVAVAMPIDLALRLGDLGLRLDPARLEVKGEELYQAALAYLRAHSPVDASRLLGAAGGSPSAGGAGRQASRQAERHAGRQPGT